MIFQYNTPLKFNNRTYKLSYNIEGRKAYFQFREKIKTISVNPFSVNDIKSELFRYFPEHIK